MHSDTARLIKTLALTGLCFLLLSLTAGAETRALKVYLGGGLTAPVGPEAFRKDHNTGFHVFMGVRYPLRSNTELTGRLEYHLITIDFREHFGTNIDLTGGGIDMLLLGSDLKQYVRPAKSSFRPFIFVGGGWSRLSQSSITAELAFEQYAPLLLENQSRFYFNLGIGSDIKASQTVNLFILIRYLEIKQDDDNIKLLPVTVGFRL